MKILIVNTVKFAVNGISTVIMNYYQNMDREDMEFDFIVCDYIDEKYKKIIKDNNDNIHVLHNRKTKPLSYFKRLQEIFRNNEYDVVHVHGNSSTMVLELAAIPKDYSITKIAHGHNVETNYKLLNKILKKTFLKSFDYAFTASDMAGNWLYGKHEYMIMNNGIDTCEFKFDLKLRNQYRNKLAINDKFVLLHVGRFEEQKNHIYLIDIFNEVQKINPNTVLLLIGIGSKYDQIKQKVKDLGLVDKVIFLGQQYETAPFFMAADVFVFPSRFESFGIVNIEAQCTGLKCVISDTIPKEVNVTNNITYLPINIPSQSWAKHILKYKKDDNRIDMSKTVIANGFGIKENAEKLKRFYIMHSNNN